LAEVAKEKNTSVIGISLDSKEKTVAYLSDNGIKYEVHVARNAEAFRRQNRITGIPQTIFRSPLGTVKKIWGGLLPENGVEEIAEAISQNRL
jgi:peroxiredoxin